MQATGDTEKVMVEHWVVGGAPCTEESVGNQHGEDPGKVRGGVEGNGQGVWDRAAAIAPGGHDGTSDRVKGRTRAEKGWIGGVWAAEPQPRTYRAPYHGQHRRRTLNLYVGWFIISAAMRWVGADPLELPQSTIENRTPSGGTWYKEWDLGQFNQDHGRSGRIESADKLHGRLIDPTERRRCAWLSLACDWDMLMGLMLTIWWHANGEGLGRILPARRMHVIEYARRGDGKGTARSPRARGQKGEDQGSPSLSQ